MAEIRQAEYQDRNGNIYHFHTDSEIVKYNDTTVKEYLDSLENNNIGSPIIEATGTNNYIGSSARITSMSKGTKCTLFIENNSTGNCTLNINGLGRKNIKDSNGNIVKNLKANIPYNLCYNGQDFILQGKGGGGNLIAKYLLSGYYGEGDNGRIDGTMVNRGAPTVTLNCGGTYNLSEGYYSGGQIKANSLASQMTNNGVTLTSANQILSGVKAISNTGQVLTGTATASSICKISDSITIYSGAKNEYVYGDLPSQNFICAIGTLKCGSYTSAALCCTINNYLENANIVTSSNSEIRGYGGFKKINGIWKAYCMKSISNVNFTYYILY